MPSLLQIILKNEADVLEQVRAAIERGEDLNAVSKHGENALRSASYRARFDVVELLLNAGADRAQLRWTKLLAEVVFGTPDDIRTAVREGGDLETRDAILRTPFLFAIQCGDIDKVSLLMALGAAQDAVGFGGKTPMQYAVDSGVVSMMQWLVNQGFDIESADDAFETPVITAAKLGRAACLAWLIEHGAAIDHVDDFSQSAMSAATTLEIVRMLLAHGADINDISTKMRVELLGVADNENPETTRDHYLAGRFRRFGQGNPERLDDPFCTAMIRSGAGAFRANAVFLGRGQGAEQAVWTYDRMGRTTTILSDGRIVEIAGEHEDYYDPDFCIYNDVTVFATDGTFRMYGYPEALFAPTDFHTATIIENGILIVGNLGYATSRQAGHTPVFRLDTTTFAIEKIETVGDCPGWIHGHKAVLDERGRILVTGGQIDRGKDVPSIENFDDWLLDPAVWRWTRLTNRGWRQWNFVRADRKPNHLWQIRQALWARDFKGTDKYWTDKYLQETSELERMLGHAPDLDSLALLYQFGGPDMPAPNERRGFIRVQVDGVALRLEEHSWSVHAVVEGTLSDASIKSFQDEVLRRLAGLEGAEWVVVAGPLP